MLEPIIISYAFLNPENDEVALPMAEMCVLYRNPLLVYSDTRHPANSVY